MSILLGWGGRFRGLFTATKGPWGPSGSDSGGDEPPSDESPSGPWGEPGPRKRRSGLGTPGNVTSFDEFLRRGRARFGGGGGGIPGRPDRSLIVWAVLGVVALAMVFSSFHVISPG